MSTYWGLRKYAGEQRTVWGGDKECVHEWDVSLRPGQTGGKSQKQESNVGAWYEPTENATCQRCGAWYGAYGLEDTPERWADHTTEWLRAVRRVLRKDGLVFLNVGDSYSGSWGDYSGAKRPPNPDTWQRSSYDENKERPPNSRPLLGYKPLDLIHTPSLLIPRLLADGWYLRSVIVWAKPNPMPESVSGTRWERHKAKVKAPQRQVNGMEHLKGTPGHHESVFDGTSAQWADCEGCATCALNDGLVLRHGSWRPTEATEWILMLAKSSQYYADGEGVREPHVKLWDERNGGSLVANTGWTNDALQHQRTSPPSLPNPAGRNLRNVWTFPTEPFPQAHFATYPTELVRRCILASTPDAGCCAVCGAPWARVIEAKIEPTQRVHNGNYDSDTGWAESGWLPGQRTTSTLGWRSTCSHDAPAQPSLVLDPFGGSGTTGVVARSLGRRFVLCELSESYVAMALRRLARTQPAMGLV